MNCFIVANQNQAFIYEYDTIKPLNQIDININSSTENGLSILNLNLSKNETYLAIIMGKRNTNMTYTLSDLLIYE